MFNGYCGEAYFLAAIFARTGDGQYCRASLQALAALQSAVRDPQRLVSLVETNGAGLAGVGSIPYALLGIGRFLDCLELERAARVVARALDPRAIAAQRGFSVMWGAAGAILGLTAVADAGDDDALSLATAWGDHLLASRVADPASELPAWPSDHSQATLSQFTGGFAHGTGGIAHALFELYRRVGDRRYYQAAIDGWACERHWLRRGGDPGGRARDPGTAENLRGSWCCGSVGVGVSRLAALDFLNTGDRGEVETDLRAAIETTRTPMRWPIDTMCCGRAGRVDCLLECGRQLNMPALTRAANEMAETMVAVWMGPPERQPRNSVSADRGLWQGFAGLGYTLLRLADTTTFPSVLRLA